jgi:hypothetical protein
MMGLMRTLQAISPAVEKFISSSKYIQYSGRRQK